MSDVVTASIGSHSPANLIRWHSATSRNSSAGRVERPPFGIGQPDAGLCVSAEHPLAKPPVRRLISQLDDIRPMRLRCDHRHQLTGNDPGQPQPWLEVL